MIEGDKLMGLTKSDLVHEVLKLRFQIKAKDEQIAVLEQEIKVGHA
jgi:hypothetical protein